MGDSDGKRNPENDRVNVSSNFCYNEIDSELNTIEGICCSDYTSKMKPENLRP